jgi:hypothetical protein
MVKSKDLARSHLTGPPMDPKSCFQQSEYVAPTSQLFLLSALFKHYALENGLPFRLNFQQNPRPALPNYLSSLDGPFGGSASEDL